MLQEPCFPSILSQIVLLLFIVLNVDKLLIIGITLTIVDNLSSMKSSVKDHHSTHVVLNSLMTMETSCSQSCLRLPWIRRYHNSTTSTEFARSCTMWLLVIRFHQTKYRWSERCRIIGWYYNYIHVLVGSTGVQKNFQ